nr:SDR family NAD(P)-dependent oxidoreductase [Actinomycetes bacterium]
MSVLIVGAGPGMGTALAHTFGSPDQPVALIGNDSQTLETIVDGLVEQDIRAKAAVADTGDTLELVNAIGGLTTEVGTADVVIYNASAFVDGPPSEVPPGEFAAGLAVGITGGLVTLQAVLPAMRAAGSGTVIFTGSATAVNPWAAAVGLSVQKAGIRNLAIAACEELAPENIRVCTITIMGTLKRDSIFDPKVIAPAFARVAATPASQWQAEVRYPLDLAADP